MNRSKLWILTQAWRRAHFWYGKREQWTWECLLDYGTKDLREQRIRRSQEQKHPKQPSPPSRKKATHTVRSGIPELLWHLSLFPFRMIACGRAWLDTHQIHFFFMGIQQPSKERWLRNKPSEEQCLKVMGRRASYPGPVAPALSFSEECSWVLKQMWQKPRKDTAKALVRKYSEVYLLIKKKARRNICKNIFYHLN